LRARGDYGHVYDSKATSATVLEENPPIVFKPKFENGYVYDLLGGIGYQFHAFCDTLIIAPIVGWSENVMNIKMHNGPIIGAFPDDSLSDAELAQLHYNGRSQGPWVGLDMIFCPVACMNVFASVEWHWSDYHQKHNDHITGIITPFPGVEIFLNQKGKIKQSSNNGAIEATLAADYAIWDCLSLGVVGHYRYLKGTLRKSIRIQEQFFTDANGNEVLPPSTEETPTKKAKFHWQTYDIALALIYRF
jgi:hypothetical protein